MKKKYGQGHYLEKVKKFFGGGWLKVKWQWEGWPMFNVHRSWIVTDAHKWTDLLTCDDDAVKIDVSFDQHQCRTLTRS